MDLNLTVSILLILQRAGPFRVFSEHPLRTSIKCTALRKNMTVNITSENLNREGARSVRLSAKFFFISTINDATLSSV